MLGVCAVFDRARDQLLRSRAAVDALKHSTDERSFLVRFNEAVASFQLVLIALLKEGRGERIPGFDAWYTDAMRRMDSDELMSMVREARDFDFGDGPHRIRFVKGHSNLQADELGRPVNQRSWWTLPYDPSQHASIDNAPRTHAGGTLDRNDPVSLAEEVLATLDRLVDEASGAVGVAA